MKKRSQFPSIFAIFLGVAFLISPLGAQVDRGTITGRVTDDSGGSIPGVQVVAENQATGVRMETITNEYGLYTLSNVPIGRYKIIFSLTGFKALERTGIELTVAEALRLDGSLEVGEISETVTVTTSAGLLNRQNPLVATTIQSEVITDLPLSFAGGRAIENFAYKITPAVEGNNWTSYIAGGAAFSKEVLIDGVSATAQIQGHIGESSPTMEAVQEFKVQTSGMGAEYGRTSGGIFNFALKSGSNDLHGSAFYYARNEALNANSWMNNWRLSQSPGDRRFRRARDRQSLGGGSAGGPVRIPGVYDGRTRTFFFGAFEHYVQQRLQLGPANVTVPIPEFLEGNFSKLLTTTVVGKDALGRNVLAGQMFDPGTLRRVGTQWVSDPFVGNIIPKARFSTLSSKITDLYRKHYLPMFPDRLTNNSARTQFNDPWFHQTQLTLKGDHTLSEGNTLTGSLIWTQRPRILVDQGGVWDPLDPNNTGGPFARSRKQEVTSRAARLSNNWTLRPNLVNVLSLAFNRYRNPSLSTQSKGGWNEKLGLSNSTSAGHFPDITFGPAVNGIGTDRIGYSSAGYYVANTYILSESMGWVTGRHNFKFGGEFWHMQINSHSGIDTLAFGFSPHTTGMPGNSWSNRVGFGFASFLLGDVDSASKHVGFDLYGRRNYVALYAQDDFKISPDLTLNLGLRWEQTQPFYEKYGRWANFSPNVMNTRFNLKGALEFPKQAGDSFERQRDWKEFSPRLGVAYQLTDRMVLRGGYGIFFTPIGIQHWSGVPYGFAPGFRGTNFIPASGNLPRFNWDSGYPDRFIAANQDPNTLIWGMVAIDERSLFAGYTHQYNVSLQYELGKDMMIEATFMGNQGRRLHNGSLRRNQPTRAVYEDPKLNPFAWVFDAASAAKAGVNYPYPGFAAFAGMAVQPFPHVSGQTWGPIYYVGSPLARSEYRSLQFSLTKKLAQNVAAQMSYNLSRAVGNSENAFEERWDVNANLQDVFAAKRDSETILPYDQTHIFKGYVTFQLPFGRGRKFGSDLNPVLDAILGGWNITTMFRYNSGNPLGIFPNVSYPGWEGAIYADVAPNADFSSKFSAKTFNPGRQDDPGNLYFDQSGFSNPTNHKLGNGRRLYSELRGFGFAGEDIGVLKYFRVGEGFSLQLRGEFINAFNRHYYANPGLSLGNRRTFGYVSSATGVPRVIQVGLRLGW